MKADHTQQQMDVIDVLQARLAEAERVNGEQLRKELALIAERDTLAAKLAVVEAAVSAAMGETPWSDLATAIAFITGEHDEARALCREFAESLKASGCFCRPAPLLQVCARCRALAAHPELLEENP